MSLVQLLAFSSVSNRSFCHGQDLSGELVTEDRVAGEAFKIRPFHNCLCGWPLKNHTIR